MKKNQDKEFDEVIFNLFIMSFFSHDYLNLVKDNEKKHVYDHDTKSAWFGLMRNAFPENEHCGEFYFDLSVSIENDTEAILRKRATANYILE